jgi:hypothetical protein
MLQNDLQDLFDDFDDFDHDDGVGNTGHQNNQRVDHRIHLGMDNALRNNRTDLGADVGEGILKCPKFIHLNRSIPA